MNRSHTLGAIATLAIASAAHAQFFDTTQTANGNWDVAAGAIGPITDSEIGQSLGALTPNVSTPIVDGISALANGPDATNDSVGFVITLGASTTEFSLTFPQPIRGVSFDIANGNVTNGLTLDTGLNLYDIEALNGGAVFNPIGIIEASPFSTVTFRVTDPSGPTEFFFLDEPVRWVVPAPGATAMLAVAGGLAAARRRRRG